MIRYLFFCSIILMGLLSGCTSVVYQDPDYYTEQIQQAQDVLLVEFELESSSELDSDVTNSIQSKLVELKKYRFAGKYNQGGHYVLRELNEQGTYDVQESFNSENLEPDYLLKIHLSPERTIKGSGAVRNFIYSCVASFTFEKKNDKILANGQDQARRGVTQKRNFSSTESGQDAKDDQANINDMIQISFNRICAQIYNAIPLTATIQSGFGDSYTINKGRQEGFHPNQNVVILMKENDTCIPVAKATITAIHSHLSNIEVTDWINADMENTIGGNIQYLKQNQNKLFVLAENVDREFFKK